MVYNSLSLKAKRMTKIKSFFLNGQEYYTSYNLTITELIEYFDYNNSLLILEYNHLIWDKKNWDKTTVQNNDKIEIVTLVGGG